MCGFNSLEEARRYFSGDRFATENGMVLDDARQFKRHFNRLQNNNSNREDNNLVVLRGVK